MLLVVVARSSGATSGSTCALWRQQLAYALPFALAVGIEVVLHQLPPVRGRRRASTPATFAIYAVGCLQIPLVDLIMTSTVNVMMVKMAEDASDRRAALALWHDTVSPPGVPDLSAGRRCSSSLARAVHRRAVHDDVCRQRADLHGVGADHRCPPCFAVDAVLRVYAQTRFLLVMNLVRLAFVAA